MLSCQGGGGMTFDISNVGEKAPLEVVMARAATTTPGPGECTWLDRPLNANEPTRLHIEEQGSVQAACNAQGQCNIGQTTKHILAIINAIRGSGAFFVHVHNNNAGYLEISRPVSRARWFSGCCASLLAGLVSRGSSASAACGVL